jgi:hypothetical protein
MSNMKKRTDSRNVRSQTWLNKAKIKELEEGGGAVGPEGPQGIQGEQGDPGADGADGVDGSTAATSLTLTDTVLLTNHAITLVSGVLTVGPAI